LEELSRNGDLKQLRFKELVFWKRIARNREPSTRNTSGNWGTGESAAGYSNRSTTQPSSSREEVTQNNWKQHMANTYGTNIMEYEFPIRSPQKRACVHQFERIVHTQTGRAAVFQSKAKQISKMAKISSSSDKWKRQYRRPFGHNQ